MKKYMFALATFLAFAPQIFSQNYKLVEFPSVYLNPNTSIQRTITHKDEKSGVKDIQKILGIEYYEQGWIFIPNHSKPDSSRWINITEKMYANGEGFAVDTLQLEQIMKTNDEIIDFHFHKSLRDTVKISEEAKRSLERYGKFDSSITYSFLLSEILENELAKNAMPSIIPDIPYMIDNTTRYLELNPDGKISFKVCSELGIAEYQLTKKGIELFKKVGRKNLFLFNRKNKGKSSFTEIYDKDLDAIETARRFCKEMSSDMVSVDFKTYEEFYSPKNR